MYIAIAGAADEVVPPSVARQESDEGGDFAQQAKPRWTRTLALATAGLAAVVTVGLQATQSRRRLTRVTRQLDPQMMVEEVPQGDAFSSKMVVNAEPEACPGEFKLEGFGQVSLVNAKWDVPGESARHVDVHNSSGLDQVEPHMKGRAYFASSCSTEGFDNTQYVALRLLGRTLRYSVDLSGAGCGCNAALYLVSMRQNEEPSDCGDYYCDANSVCGISCAEVDIQEANKYAWYSTLHSADDAGGLGSGYGAAHTDWTGREYAPGAECIDTSEPFEVSVSFPVDESGRLIAMQIQLSQEGHPCKLNTQVDSYAGMAGVSEALAAGMTPVISYWSSDDMLWMDGKGAGDGPCETDVPSACADTIRFSGFSLSDIEESFTHSKAATSPQLEETFGESKSATAQPTPAPPTPLGTPPLQGIFGDTEEPWMPDASVDFGRAQEARPTAEPTTRPTARPTTRPTARPTAMPTAHPTWTPAPTAPPVVHTPAPTASTTPAPTREPTSPPTAQPTAQPTEEPVMHFSQESLRSNGVYQEEPATSPTPAPWWAAAVPAPTPEIETRVGGGGQLPLLQSSMGGHGGPPADQSGESGGKHWHHSVVQVLHTTMRPYVDGST